MSEFDPKDPNIDRFITEPDHLVTDEQAEIAQMKEAVSAERENIVAEALADDNKSISFEDIIEGETAVRLMASYTLVDDGFFVPDYKDGLQLTELGISFARGKQALNDG